MKSSHVLFNIASYTAIMVEKIILKTPGKKMAFLATCLSFLVENTLFFFFNFISLRLESGLFSSHLYVPFITVQEM